MFSGWVVSGWGVLNVLVMLKGEVGQSTKGCTIGRGILWVSRFGSFNMVFRVFSKVRPYTTMRYAKTVFENNRDVLFYLRMFTGGMFLFMVLVFSFSFVLRLPAYIPTAPW